MVLHPCGDEVIAVVVAGLHAQLQRVLCSIAGLAQKVGLQLGDQKLIGIALVDQQGQALFGAVDELARIPVFPCCWIWP